MRRRAALLILVLLVVAGCSTAGGPPPRASETPRVRCLNRPGPGETAGDRPLFYIFCIESP